MTEIIALDASARDRAGKGTARATRRAGQIPAVIYGNKEKPVLIALDDRQFTRQLHRPGFFTHLFDIKVDGVTHRTLPRDVQFDPVSDKPLHVDFLRVSETTEILVHVPVEFVNQETSPGIKRGGMLNIVRHEIDVFCRAGSIPEHISVDVSKYDLGDSIHISAVQLPEGVRPTVDRDFTIATIAAPSAVKSEAIEAAAAAQAAG
jgi:large subunit ribosomal protein L25